MRKLSLIIPLLCILLSACAADMLAAPRTDGDFALLSQQSVELYLRGARHIIPDGGDMGASTMKIDLDGDGADETVSCLLRGDTPIVEVYAEIEENEEKAGRLVGSGDGIDVLYFPRIGDDKRAVAAGWRLGTSSVHGVTIGIYDDGVFTPVYSGVYTNIACSDMDSDGTDEILLVRSIGDKAAVVMLTIGESGVTESAPVPLSDGMDEPERVYAANIGFERSALLCEAYIEAYGYVSDVIIVKDGGLVNIYRSAQTGVSNATARSLAMWCYDANGDGTVELPTRREVSDAAEHVSAQLIDWRRFDDSGGLEYLYTTYHSPNEGWYMRLPQGMEKEILPVPSISAPDTVSTMFYFLSGEGERGSALWEVYRLSGEDALRREHSSALRRLAIADGYVYALRAFNYMSGKNYSRETLPGMFAAPAARN